VFVGVLDLLVKHADKRRGMRCGLVVRKESNGIFILQQNLILMNSIEDTFHTSSRI